MAICAGPFRRRGTYPGTTVDSWRSGTTTQQAIRDHPQPPRTQGLLAGGEDHVHAPRVHVQRLRAHRAHAVHPTSMPGDLRRTSSAMPCAWAAAIPSPWPGSMQQEACRMSSPHDASGCGSVGRSAGCAQRPNCPPLHSLSMHIPSSRMFQAHLHVHQHSSCSRGVHGIWGK